MKGLGTKHRKYGIPIKNMGFHVILKGGWGEGTDER